MDLSGNAVWTSDPLEGAAMGSPLISDDGRYVFLTHNTMLKSVGYFTALFAAQSGVTFYSMSNETHPFSEPGIFHSPAEGYYDGLNGVGNTNDVILFGNAVATGAQVIGLGSTFVFQFPVGFADTTDGVGYLVLGEQPRDFLVEAAPVLTNQGRSAYWSVSRSGWVCWAGDGLLRDNFSQGPAGRQGGTRNDDFRGTPTFASLALSSSTTQPFVFGGSAAPEFARMNFDMFEYLAVPTAALIMAEAKVDPMDRAVYFIEDSGMLHQVNFDDLTDLWTLDMGFPVEGEMALKADGSVLYVADSAGKVTALTVADVPGTIAPATSPPAPSETPSEVPSAGPSMTAMPIAPVTPSPVAPTPAPVTPAPVTPATPSPVDDSTPAPEASNVPDEPTTEAPSEATTEEPGNGDSGAMGLSFLTSFALIASSIFCIF